MAGRGRRDEVNFDGWEFRSGQPARTPGISHGLVGGYVAAVHGLAGAAAGGEAPATTVLVANVDFPVYVTHALGDPERLFAVAREGRIDVVRDGGMLAEPCLDLSKLVRTAGNEQGLLGLAFHPDFKSTGYFYVNDTREHNGRTVIGRYEISADPDIASPDRR
ncbi:MAG: PQQ-dependent sugar dehydrogenase [Planctomycetota bacterium]